jgi:hypothetical protein
MMDLTGLVEEKRLVQQAYLDVTDFVKGRVLGKWGQTGRMQCIAR